MTRALTLSCLASLALAACGDERPVLTDEDGGPSPTDMTLADLGPDPDASMDAGTPDLGPPPDMGPPCPIGPDPAPTDPTAGEWDRRFYLPGVGGTAPTDVLSVAIDADDVVYVGGHFSHGNDIPAQNVVSWEDGVGFTPLGDGLPGDVVELEIHPTTGDVWAIVRELGHGIYRWDGSAWSLEHESPGFLNALAFAPDGTLIVGGSFDAIDGESVSNLAAYRGGSWLPVGGASPDEQVLFILAEADSLCIGGRFSNVGATEAISVACHDGSSWSARSLPVPGYEVRVLARDSSGALLAGGHFDLDPGDGEDGGSIARWDGTEWGLMGQGFVGSIGPGYVDVIQVVGDLVYAAGSFRASGATDVNSVSRFESGAWGNIGGAFAEVGFGIETNNVFDGATTSTGKLLIGGRFTRVGSMLASHVALWDETFAWSTLEKPTGGAAGVGGFVDALAARGPCELYAGGEFNYVGTEPARNVVRVTPTGPEAMGAGPVGVVRALAVAEDGTVYAGGDLADGNLVQYQGGATWPMVGGGVNGAVAVLLVASDGRLWVGGDFTEVGSGVAAEHIAVWDGTDWAVPAGGVDGPVRALLELADGTIVAGGAFEQAGATPAINIASWDGAEWSAYGDGLPADLSGRGVRSLAFFEGQIVAGGQFLSLPDADGAGIATWTGSAWETVGDGLFSPYTFSPASPNALVVVGDALFATGNNIAATDGGEDTRLVVYRGGSWAAFGELTDVSEAMVATPEALWVGGTFTRAGPIPAVGLASFLFD